VDGESPESRKTLAERLGYPADARLAIFNCDDLGSSHAANIASLEAMEKGVASSGTLMVPCPWAMEAVRLFQDQDVGVHLTLTAEYPGYRWRSLTGAASLHDDEGYLPRTAEEVWARADLTDAGAELRAQIDQACAWGVDVTHLDSHMGVNQIDRRFYGLYLELAEEYRLPVRMAGRTAESVLGFPIRAPACARGLLHPDEFYYRWKAPTAELHARYVPQIPPGSVAEFVLHTVVDGEELRGYDLEAAQVRVDDYAVALAAATKALIDREKVTTIGFRPIRDLQRAETRAQVS
jgi:predicted glycoside hydrolase/deacetylase ChbG (UPF0249 family)